MEEYYPVPSCVPLPMSVDWYPGVLYVIKIYHCCSSLVLNSLKVYKMKGAESESIGDHFEIILDLCGRTWEFLKWSSLGRSKLETEGVSLHRRLSFIHFPQHITLPAERWSIPRSPGIALAFGV